MADSITGSSTKSSTDLSTDSPTVDIAPSITVRASSTGSQGTFGSQAGRMDARTGLIARVAWVLLVVVVVALFVLSVPIHHSETRTAVPEATRSIYRLGPTDPDRLAGMGLSATFYGVVLNTADVIFMVVHLALAIFVFAVRRNDWKALLFSAVLVIHGSSYGQSLRSLAEAEPTFDLAIRIIESLYWFGAFCTLLLFPDGRFVPKPMRWLALLWGIWLLQYRRLQIAGPNL